MKLQNLVLLCCMAQNCHNVTSVGCMAPNRNILVTTEYKYFNYLIKDMSVAFYVFLVLWRQQWSYRFFLGIFNVYKVQGRLFIMWMGIETCMSFYVIVDIWPIWDGWSYKRFITSALDSKQKTTIAVKGIFRDGIPQPRMTRFFNQEVDSFLLIPPISLKLIIKLFGF